MANKNESLSKSIKELMFKEPFWGLFLIGFRKSWNDSIGTACVCTNGLGYGLWINSDFWEGLNDDHRKFVLQHEAIHIGYHHLLDHDKFEDKELRNIADDIVVNQDCNQDWKPGKDMTPEEFRAKYKPIMEAVYEDFKAGKITREEYNKETHKIPPRGVYLEDFPDLKLKPRESRQYYYDALKQAKDKCEKNKEGGKPGKNGNGSTNPSENTLMELLDSGMVDDDGPLGHGSWKEFENMTEAEKKLVKAQLDYHLKEVAEQVTKSRGFVPGNIKNYLDLLDVQEEAKFNWRQYLKRFAGGSIKTYTKKLRRKYNKRFEDNPGLKIKQRKHIFLAVDTSGSVSNDELRIFFSEINHIQRTGTQVTICQCDATISNISEYKSGMKINNREKKVAVYGRGGTDFQPPIDYYNENQKKFSCMVYFTDGECSALENPPKDKLLWVISNGKDNEELPGYRIVFEN